MSFGQGLTTFGPPFPLIDQRHAERRQHAETHLPWKRSEPDDTTSKLTESSIIGSDPAGRLNQPIDRHVPVEALVTGEFGSSLAHDLRLRMQSQARAFVSRRADPSGSWAQSAGVASPPIQTANPPRTSTSSIGSGVSAVAGARQSSPKNTATATSPAVRIRTKRQFGRRYVIKLSSSVNGIAAILLKTPRKSAATR